MTTSGVGFFALQILTQREMKWISHKVIRRDKLPHKATPPSLEPPDPDAWDKILKE